jgi:hypothetical protein
MTTTTETLQPAAATRKPFPPSYLDRFMDAIERLPIPYWLTYSSLFVIQGLLLHVLSWLDGWLPAYTFEGILLLHPLWLWVPFAIMTYLNRTSLEAITSFSPLLGDDVEAVDRLRHEFTTMPNRGVLMSVTIWALLYVLFLSIALRPLVAVYEFGPFITAISVVLGVFSFTQGGTMYYHSIRQLRLVSRTVQRVKHFNVFQIEPVYAFSRLTARTGIAWVFISTALLLIIPRRFAAPFLTMAVSQIFVAILVFALPLWSVHQRLTVEKRVLQAGLQVRVESTLAQLHRELDENEFGEIAGINDALAGLEAERAVLQRIPTWPWRPGTLSGFLSVVVLPLVIFLVQLAIENILGN